MCWFHAARMTPRLRTVLAAGVAAQLAGSWLSSARPRSAPAFGGELIWASAAMFAGNRLAAADSISSACGSRPRTNSRRSTMPRRSGWPGGYTNTERPSYCTISLARLWTRPSPRHSVTETRSEKHMRSTSDCPRTSAAPRRRPMQQAGTPEGDYASKRRTQGYTRHCDMVARMDPERNEGSPEVFDDRLALHYGGRVALHGCCSHPGGALHHKSGRRMAIALVALDMFEARLLRAGRFDERSGRALRVALDALDAAFAESAVRSKWPAGGGSQALPIPMTVETAYRHGALRALRAVAPATIAVTAVRAARGRPLFPSDLLLWPSSQIAMGKLCSRTERRRSAAFRP